MLLGLSGYARAGKDTVGEILAANHGFRRVSFADKLRAHLTALDPYLIPNAGKDENCRYMRSYHPSRRLSELLAQYGSSEGIKASPYSEEWRRLQQNDGTEAGRAFFGENVWVDLALKDIVPTDNVVVTDCRFPNEFAAVKKLGGHMWRVARTGVGKANDHPSETSLDNHNFERIIANHGTIADLEKEVQVAFLLSSPPPGPPSPPKVLNWNPVG